LTTVHVDMLQLGERAVEQLLTIQRGDGGPDRHHDVLPTTLVVRKSCGAALLARGDARIPLSRDHRQGAISEGPQKGPPRGPGPNTSHLDRRRLKP
jgi:hypothetical protein